nr:kinetochore-associated protein 1 [Leptinotarsa decemlineata]
MHLYGADKVNAASLSYKYATKYIKSNPDSLDVETAYKKVKNKYYGYSAMHILHKFNLADDKYLNLVTQPDTLVENLYMDPRIIKQAQSVNLGYPDINRAVDSLAELFALKITKMRISLLNQWLSNSSVLDLDTTSVFLPNMSTQVKNFDGDDNLKRAIYVCGSGDLETWQTYLLTVGLFEDKNDEQKSLSFKAKALKCFCAITDKEKIAELTKISYLEFLDFVDKLTLLSELECLGISLTIETLDQYNKKELLKRLSQIGKPLAIKSMGSICMTYFLDENRYWEYIIKNSIKLRMVEELKVYVDYLKDNCDKNYFIKAWQVIIENAFQQTKCLTDDELEEMCIKNFLMIQACPVLFYLDFEKIIQLCLNLRKFEYAAVLLQYLPEDKKTLYSEEILKCETVLMDLENLDNKGIWGIRNIKKWLGEKAGRIC